MIDFDFMHVLRRVEDDADFLDLRFLKAHHLSIVLENGEIQCGARDVIGVGVRALVNGCWAFSSTSTLSSLTDTVRRVIRSANHLGPGTASLPEFNFKEDHIIHPVKRDQRDVDVSEKIAELQDLKEIMSLPRIKETRVFYNEMQGTKTVVNTMGCSIEEEFSQTAVDFFSIAFEGGKTVMASDRKYAVGGCELFSHVGEMPIETSQRAVRLLSAKTVKEGYYPAILDSELTGVFVHEALGHCAEADVVLERRSFLQDSMNKRIAPEGMTVCDDPHLPGGSVFFAYDDEGVPAQKTVLVKDGVFKAFMHSIETAALCESEPTGNTRVNTYSSNPVIRMTNTYMAPGEETSEEMVENINQGISLKKTFGGEVDVTTGGFVFKAQEGDFIENGKVTKHLKNIFISGTIEEFLQNIEGIGCDFAMSSGTCAKADQTLVIGSGGPPVRLSKIRIGGSL